MSTTSLSCSTWSTVTCPSDNIFALTSNSNFLFAITSFPGNNTLYKINLQNPTSYSAIINNQALNAAYIASDSSYVYLPNYSTGGVTRYDFSGNKDNSWIINTGIEGTTSVTVDGNYLYIGYQNAGSSRVSQVNISTKSLVTTWASLPNRTEGLFVMNGYMYVNCDIGSKIVKIPMNYATNPPTAGTVNTNFINAGFTNIAGYSNFIFGTGGNTISIFDATTGSLLQRLIITNAFIGNTYSITGITVATINSIPYLFFGDVNIFQIPISMISAIIYPPCFLEGTQILTDKGYRPIQELRKGDLVKTLLNGFLPIDMIGKKDIAHPASQERIKHQLYVCSTAQYPELTENLVITGCHSILVDDFTDEEQRARTKKVLEEIYITDNKYRLPACIDGRTEVYEKPGTYTIYHLALINNDYFMNYGIYANGLLVETCTKRYLRECSGMDLL
jgi:hypothetical protein